MKIPTKEIDRDALCVLLLPRLQEAGEAGSAVSAASFHRQLLRNGEVSLPPALEP
jgi:hypothetical protein